MSAAEALKERVYHVGKPLPFQVGNMQCGPRVPPHIVWHTGLSLPPNQRHSAAEAAGINDLTTCSLACDYSENYPDDESFDMLDYVTFTVYVDEDTFTLRVCDIQPATRLKGVFDYSKEGHGFLRVGSSESKFAILPCEQDMFNVIPNVGDSVWFTPVKSPNLLCSVEEAISRPEGSDATTVVREMLAFNPMVEARGVLTQRIQHQKTLGFYITYRPCVSPAHPNSTLGPEIYHLCRHPALEGRILQVGSTVTCVPSIRKKPHRMALNIVTMFSTMTVELLGEVVTLPTNTTKNEGIILADLTPPAARNSPAQSSRYIFHAKDVTTPNQIHPLQVGDRVRVTLSCSEDGEISRSVSVILAATCVTSTPPAAASTNNKKATLPSAKFLLDGPRSGGQKAAVIVEMCTLQLQPLATVYGNILPLVNDKVQLEVNEQGKAFHIAIVSAMRATIVVPGRVQIARLTLGPSPAVATYVTHNKTLAPIPRTTKLVNIRVKWSDNVTSTAAAGCVPGSHNRNVTVGLPKLEVIEISSAQPTTPASISSKVVVGSTNGGQAATEELPFAAAKPAPGFKPIGQQQQKPSSNFNNSTPVNNNVARTHGAVISTPRAATTISPVAALLSRHERSSSGNGRRTLNTAASQGAQSAAVASSQEFFFGQLEELQKKEALWWGTTSFYTQPMFANNQGAARVAPSLADRRLPLQEWSAAASLEEEGEDFRSFWSSGVANDPPVMTNNTRDNFLTRGIIGSPPSPLKAK